MRFFHDDIPVSIGQDDYREEAINNWNRLTVRREGRSSALTNESPSPCWREASDGGHSQV